MLGFKKILPVVAILGLSACSSLENTTQTSVSTLQTDGHAGLPTSSSDDQTATVLPPASLTGLTLRLEERQWLSSLHEQQPPHSHLGLKGPVSKDPSSELISVAMSLIGTPYRSGGTNAGSGFDCSGFVQNVFADVAQYELPRIAKDQAAATTAIKKSELRPGDLVFFNTMRRAFSHVGIYVGDGKFIHSPRTGAVVRVESMNTSYWVKRFNGARRVPLAAADQSSIDSQN